LTINRPVSWDLISAFVEVIDAGSYTEAARRRGVTRSNLSQRIQQLERLLNAQLIRRSTRRLEPTEAGLTLYAHGQRMALEFETARGEIEGLGSKLMGHVRLSVPTGLGDAQLRPLLVQFAQLHPDITLRVAFNNRIADLIAGEVDIALKVANRPPDDVVAQEICDVGWMLCASPRYLENAPSVLEPGDLKGHPFLSSLEGRNAKVVLERQQQRIKTEVSPRIRSERLPFLREAALQGLGIAMLPAYLILDDLRNGQLVRVLPEHWVKEVGDKLFVLTIPNRYPSASVRALTEFLRGHLKPMGYFWAPPHSKREED